ncbi:MFS general substrate transporter [Glarea lozoyensis ATCC 20868]|uniref:MFS general substrate transporter n=1 Tax=Glarea lozoyensis (strain ATCC 20868 / MF5171) TaxID=1116229 RepID=S3CUF6_GLAL2|nr:MFS general substrate transporter [Glarea lozoyensis ATCC 20868]EPE28639.1 MFS general substrate transporter [Glarea lozoyensis ATCC 20868]
MGKRNTLPFLFPIRSHPVFIVLSVAVAIFTDTFLYGLLIPVFPTLLQERGFVADNHIQIFTSILIGLMGAGVIGGCYNSKERRSSLLGGLGLLLLSTVAMWLAQNVATLCIARFVQGVASAAVWSVGLALLTDTVGGDHVAEIMGWVNIAFSCGFMAGPVVGGLLYASAGYHAVFAIASGLLVVDLVYRLLIIEKREARQLLALQNDADEEGARRPLLEGNREHTIEHKRDSAYDILVTSRRLMISLVCAFVQALLVASIEATLPIRLKAIFGYGSGQSGLMFMTLMIPSVLAPLIGYFCGRFGNAIIALSGYLVCGTAAILLRLSDHNDTESKIVLIILLVMIGIAMCMIMTPVLTEVFAAVEELEEESPGRFGQYGAFAQAYALFDIAYAGGAFIGPIFAGLVISKFSWNVMTLTLGILSFLTSLLVLPETIANFKHRKMGGEEDVTESVETSE